MPNHELEFHENHLAVNVKVRVYFDDDNLRDFAKRINTDYDELANEIQGQIYEIFWMQTAQDIARNCGFEGVYSEGRSNGWCVPLYGRKPIERSYLDNVMDEEAQTIMKNYFLFRFKIREIVKNATRDLKSALVDELTQRETDFLLANSVTARSWHFQIYGVQA